MSPIARIDFETYSEAGYVWRDDLNNWKSITASPPHGLGAVGASVYSEHPSCELISLAYDMFDGAGVRLWVPGMAPPEVLLEHILNGGLVGAFNSMFEFLVWSNVCAPRMGWPELPLEQLRDTMANARAYSIPGNLKDAAKSLRLETLKLEEGQTLIRKFCMPRRPTKNNEDRRNLIADYPKEANDFYAYNVRDVEAETAVANVCPELSDFELEVWKLDQRINSRGVAIDVESLDACIAIVEQANIKYSAELPQLTDGAVQNATELDSMKLWLAGVGLHMPSITKDTLAEVLSAPMSATVTEPAKARRVLEIRQLLGSASVKKTAAIKRRLSADGRLRDLFAYCGADRTGRWAGRGPQPQNLPNSGPRVRQCLTCGLHSHADLKACPLCFCTDDVSAKDWGVDAVEDALGLACSQGLQGLEGVFGPNALETISGCLRGLFVAGPGMDLICSDYSAIEAVVLAMIAGEQWRIDVFRTHGKIYEMSASKVTGVSFDEMIRHKQETGEHHHYRKLGKVCELASGYQGWVGAYKNFGADKYFDDDDAIKDAAGKWRNDNPMIVAFWAGMQDSFINAVLHKGHEFDYKCLTFFYSDNVLKITLPSGRKLHYHEPRVLPGVDLYGRSCQDLSYMGYNTDYEKGPKGWLRMDTYGGKLVENVTQAIARDILANAMLNVDDAGYPPVLHIHDEIVAEVPNGFGSVEEFETIMATMPDWCADWPIKAAGGWRGHRYRKD